MTSRPPAVRRTSRRAVVVVLLAALSSLALVGPAISAGTGGIEVTPLPSTVDGKQVTAFRLELPGSGSREVSFLLRNVEDGRRTASLYAAQATRSPDGSFAVGDPDSSPYVRYDERTVTLQKGAQRVEKFIVQRSAGKQPAKEVYAAIVVEVSNGSIVQRAATLVYLEPGRQLPVPLPLLLVITAVLLLLLAGAGVALLGRRRRREMAQVLAQPGAVPRGAAAAATASSRVLRRLR